uniref:Nematode cuticle collagen N-terminal domain-containing protein n=1 Tax=Caenorhabditis japonica TaxID=281687 RepID=A0A8R1DHZ7_CAEJA
MASVVVVAAGAALAVTVPFMALKEALESRMHSNMKKHLGQRSRCRVNFYMPDDNDSKYHQLSKNKCVVTDFSSDNDDNSSTISSPPSYNDITQPPAYGSLLLRSD